MTASNVIEFPHRPRPLVSVEPGDPHCGWAITVRDGQRKRQNPFIAWLPSAEKFADDLAQSRGWRRA